MKKNRFSPELLFIIYKSECKFDHAVWLSLLSKKEVKQYVEILKYFEFKNLLKSGIDLTDHGEIHVSSPPELTEEGLQFVTTQKYISNQHQTPSIRFETDEIYHFLKRKVLSTTSLDLSKKSELINSLLSLPPFATKHLLMGLLELLLDLNKTEAIEIIQTYLEKYEKNEHNQ